MGALKVGGVALVSILVIEGVRFVMTPPEWRIEDARQMELGHRELSVLSIVQRDFPYGSAAPGVAVWVLDPFNRQIFEHVLRRLDFEPVEESTL